MESIIAIYKSLKYDFAAGGADYEDMNGQETS